jgi:hypothetical protein
MAISSADIVKELLPELNRLFDIEYDERLPIKMGTVVKTKYGDVKNKAFINVSVDTLLGLWMSLFPTGFCETTELNKLSEDMLDVGRVLRDEGILKFNNNTHMYYIANKFRADYGDN